MKNALEQFRQSHSLTFSELAAICGGSANGCSRTTIRQACTGDSNDATLNRLRLILPGKIRAWLSDQGVGNVEKVVKKIEAGLTPAKKPSKDESEDTTMLARTSLDQPIALHFGLRRDPFLSPRSADDVYLTPQIQQILNDVSDATEYQEFRAVIGNVGAGKTVIRQYLEDLLAKRTDFRAVIVWPLATDMQTVSVAGIETAIFEAFGERAPMNSVSRRKKLEALLKREYERGVRVTVAFDESHRLRDRTLTSIKNLHEMGYGFVRYIGILMFGQVLLHDRIKNDLRFRELHERIRFSAVPPFAADQAWGYVAHRVRRAGGDPDAVFERKAVEHLATTALTPLALGNACNAALIQAYHLGETQVSMELLAGLQSKPAQRLKKSA